MDIIPSYAMPDKENSPCGWLTDPSGEIMILFIKDPMSYKDHKKFYVDKWSAKEGKRSAFKNRKILTELEAFQFWDSLILNGWEKLYACKQNAA